MKKLLSAISFSFLLLVLVSASTNAQPVREGVKLSPDTTFSITPLELYNPSLQNLKVSADQPNFNLSPSKTISLSTTSKLLLRLGTTIIRGSNENYPIYSFENSWTYPGPTIRYPEAAMEYELFLQRYNRYNPSSN